MPDRLVIAISGASGVIYGIRLLEVLASDAIQPRIETHLILSSAARVTITQETDWKVSDVEALATVVYDNRDIGAAIASGSFPTRGMIVAPCSIKSLSAIAHSYAADLLTRAADITLKEGRPLLLVIRETPLHLGHIRLMEQAAEIGAIIFPPVPALYARPQSVDEIIDGTVGRILARMGIDNDLYLRWSGLSGRARGGQRAQSRATSADDD